MLCIIVNSHLNCKMKEGNGNGIKGSTPEYEDDNFTFIQVATKMRNRQLQEKDLYFWPSILERNNIQKSRQ